MNTTVSLSPEWQRLNILSQCLASNRQGEDIAENTRINLFAVQEQVKTLRRKKPWAELTQANNLSALDQDILACTLAPEAEPKLGWIFQELQPGLNSHYPTPALVYELYFMNDGYSSTLRQRLSPEAPLLRSGLISCNGQGSFRPLYATHYARRALLGWPENVTTPPGSSEIEVRNQWRDLVLPKRCLRAMQEFILWLRFREKVGTRWGAKLGGGPVALFSGGPGSGKTLAAEALASELGMRLFRVDLGMLVSKYVGETEKNLNKLFDVAQYQDLILLFDEADSLFGKRASVKDARDRYANMEVSHLLSRIERHQGPCILTTNMRRHVDSAFARRFQVIVEFPMPDKEARFCLWNKLLPPGAPLDDSVELKKISEQISLSGGQIRNAALHSAFLAAGENTCIKTRHIASAIWTELEKEGSEVLPSSLGFLQPYLREEWLND